MLVLWDGFAWEVSGGLLGGDFIIRDRHAYERCPTFVRPYVPTYARQGITSLIEVIRLLRQAMA